MRALSHTLEQVRRVSSTDRSQPTLELKDARCEIRRHSSREPVCDACLPDESLFGEVFARIETVLRHTSRPRTVRIAQSGLVSPGRDDLKGSSWAAASASTGSHSSGFANHAPAPIAAGSQ
jgi:hypothetical protein